MPLARGVAVSDLTKAPQGGLRLSRDEDTTAAVLYLYGGGYRQGTPTAARGFSYVCELPGVEIVAPRYRLAPEHPAPAGLEDAMTCYVSLCAELGAERVVVAGESAGGGLAVALLQHALAEGHAPPAGLVVMFPWVDLTLNGTSIVQNGRRDLLTESTLAESARQYAAGRDLHDPVVSPLFGSFDGFPPSMIHVGTRDLLLDDSRRLADALRLASVPVTLREWPGCCHGFQNLPSPEARNCKRQVIEFVGGLLADEGTGVSSRQR
jgi:acetyl esterase/lipase